MLRVSENGAPWRLVGPRCRVGGYVGNSRFDATTKTMQNRRKGEVFRAFWAKTDEQLARALHLEAAHDARLLIKLAFQLINLRLHSPRFILYCHQALHRSFGQRLRFQRQC